jgi:hypothetical protein
LSVIALMASSSACLLSVRRAPELRGTGMGPFLASCSAWRRASARPNDYMSIGSPQFCSSAKRFDTVFA